MRNKILIAAFLLMSSVSAWADDFTIGNLKYTITDAEKHEVSVGKISNDNNPEGDLVIPAEVENEGVKYAVSTIDEYAFRGCRGLTSVTIPNTVTSIGYGAFRNCNKLTSVIIPNSVTGIGGYAFDGCYCLVEINVEGGNTAYSSDNGVLFNKGKETLICYPQGKTETAYTIPNSVTSIGSEAFYGCSGLTTVTIPNSVTSIGKEAFYGCSGLTLVDIPNSVTSIGYGAFSGCSGLTSVTIPNSVTSIGSEAFYGCSRLASVNIPDSVKRISENMFAGCRSLTEVAIPNSVTSIGKEAFYYCSGLTSVTIPESVTSIGDYAFEGCSGLTSVVIGDSVKTIGVLAFFYCGSLTSITIPESVENIASDAFFYVKNIVYTGSAEGSPWGALNINAIPDEEGFIYSDAEKTKLTAYVGDEKEVIIPISVTSISVGAFSYCTRLTSVTIPNSVIYIDDYTFEGCTATIYCEFERQPEGWGRDWNDVKYKGEIVWGYKSTPVTETAANAVNIYANGKTIVVENAAEEISVYDVMGKLICRDAINRVPTEIRVNNPGLYIVKVGNVAKRVVVR